MIPQTPLQRPRIWTWTVKVDLGQLEAPLPSSTVQLTSQSFTAATQQVLGSISTDRLHYFLYCALLASSQSSLSSTNVSQLRHENT